MPTYRSNAQPGTTEAADSLHTGVITEEARHPHTPVGVIPAACYNRTNNEPGQWVSAARCTYLQIHSADSNR